MSISSESYAPDPAARVSTGPGLPRWQWHSVHLGWTGPVGKDQLLGLWLAPPWLNSALGFLRAALVAALALCVLGGLGTLREGLVSTGRTLASGVLLALLLPAFASPARAADFPPAEILEQLRVRLLESPSCSPLCAESPRMRLEANAEVLTIVFDVDASAKTAVPLPGGLSGWSPESVLVDDTQASGLARSPDGTLWLAVDPGKHRIRLRGRLPEQDAVQLPLPLLPHALEASVEGWTLEGQRPDGPPAATLQLSRIRSSATPSAALEASDLPAFVRVERRISLGLEWSVLTQVERLTPIGRSVFLEVPLLPGESVTSEEIRVEDGRARVSLAAGEQNKFWRSVLEPADSLSLSASETLEWSEVWIVDASPVWHLETSGIPTVHEPADFLPRRVRTWQPWPGESVELEISRPAATDGPTLTLDRSALRVRPGQRAVDSTLELTLRASRGEEHEIRLPDGAELQRVAINGTEQPVRAVDGLVSLSITPGEHEVALDWTVSGGFASVFRSEAPTLALPSANAELEIEVPRDRWLLWVGGPRMGPAVLYWSTLLVALVMALVLGRLPLTPIPWQSWLLLFVGLTQVPLVVSFGVVAWLLALGARRARRPGASRDYAFNGLQILLVVLTLSALGSLVFAVQHGLLGVPEMQISGNGSTWERLRWYRDRNLEGLPTAWIVSVPILVYRLAMLAWALWLARAILRWLRWGWECFSEGGLWSPLRLRTASSSSAASPTARARAGEDGTGSGGD